MIRSLVVCLTLGVFFASSQAQEQEDDAFTAFKRARGDASWIASTADHVRADTAFRPIPPLSELPVDPDKRQLGFALYHDARLSANNTVACSSCHNGMHGGTDNLPLSIGIQGRIGKVNAPTIFNSAFNFRQFWDGRAFDLGEQALGPLSNPLEMGHDLRSVVSFVASDAGYSDQFNAIYPDGVTAANIGNAIAEHSRSMVRDDSRFNAYLQGDQSALSAQELRGWERFQAVGCASCHNGINLGGNSYQRVSNIVDFYSDRPLRPADDGLVSRTGREQDRHVFKVPSLNNVALTAPYFHDGSVNTLQEAVTLMAKTQAGRNLEGEEVEDIVAFLQSLSSEFFASRGPGAMGGGMMRQGMMRHMHQQGHHGAGAMNHGQQHMMRSPSSGGHGPR